MLTLNTRRELASLLARFRPAPTDDDPTRLAVHAGGSRRVTVRLSKLLAWPLALELDASECGARTIHTKAQATSSHGGTIKSSKLS